MPTHTYEYEDHHVKVKCKKNKNIVSYPEMDKDINMGTDFTEGCLHGHALSTSEQIHNTQANSNEYLTICFSDYVVTDN